MKRNDTFFYLLIFGCIAIVVSCFLPWAYYTAAQETFTGFRVKTFPNGNYYGRAGITISVFAGVILLLALLRRNVANRANVFIAALLFAYTIRTYILFTSSLFEGEVEKKGGIYLIVFLSALMLLSSVFPRASSKGK